MRRIPLHFLARVAAKMQQLQSIYPHGPLNASADATGITYNYQTQNGEDKTVSHIWAMALDYPRLKKESSDYDPMILTPLSLITVLNQHFDVLFAVLKTIGNWKVSLQPTAVVMEKDTMKLTIPLEVLSCIDISAAEDESFFCVFTLLPKIVTILIERVMMNPKNYWAVRIDQQGIRVLTTVQNSLANPDQVDEAFSVTWPELIHSDTPETQVHRTPADTIVYHRGGKYAKYLSGIKLILEKLGVSSWHATTREHYADFCGVVNIPTSVLPPHIHILIPWEILDEIQEEIVPEMAMA